MKYFSFKYILVIRDIFRNKAMIGMYCMHKLNIKYQIAFKSAISKNFLTPYTNLYIQNEQDSEPDLITFEDLNPVFFQVDDPDHDSKFEALKTCQKPVECNEHFHYEILDTIDQSENCNGTLRLYSRPNFEGDTLIVDKSMSQIYHETYGPRIRSLNSSGNCCWLLFDHRYSAITNLYIT